MKSYNEVRNGCDHRKGAGAGGGYAPPAGSAKAFGSYTFKMQFKCATMNI